MQTHHPFILVTGELYNADDILLITVPSSVLVPVVIELERRETDEDWREAVEMFHCKRIALVGIWRLLAYVDPT